MLMNQSQLMMNESLGMQQKTPRILLYQPNNNNIPTGHMNSASHHGLKMKMTKQRNRGNFSPQANRFTMSTNPMMSEDDDYGDEVDDEEEDEH